MNVVTLNTETNITGHTNNTVLDVLIIGAGFSGICAAIKLLEQGNRNFRIFEKSQGIGGTWWENRYPGAACDIPSHLYCYSFEPNPDWSKLFSPQAEIQAYIERCADKYGIRPYIEHGAHVLRLTFDDDSGFWRAEFADGRTIRARHVINASGGLHKPFIPDLEGRECFSGTQMHTAQWDESYDFTGKKIAVIGSAASAIQLVPELAKVAARLNIFQRTPNYIAPRNDFEYSAFRKRLYKRFPQLMRIYRWMIFSRLELMVYPIIINPKVRAKRQSQVKDHIRTAVQDTDLQKALEPEFELGCKRILLSDDFYQSLELDNVELIPLAVEGITEDGVIATDGSHYEADVIIYATGFDLHGHQLSIDIQGPGGRRLADEWADHNEAYYGSIIAGFPNYYMVTGPNTGVGTTSVVYMAEHSIHWILECIKMAGADNLLAVKAEAQKRYNAEIAKALNHSVWATGCKSWYKREDGRIEALYPYNARAFARQMSEIRMDDIEISPKPTTIIDLPATGASA